MDIGGGGTFGGEMRLGGRQRADWGGRRRIWGGQKIGSAAGRGEIGGGEGVAGKARIFKYYACTNNIGSDIK